jgi:TonB family protein
VAAIALVVWLTYVAPSNLETANGAGGGLFAGGGGGGGSGGEEITYISVPPSAPAQAAEEEAVVPDPVPVPVPVRPEPVPEIAINIPKVVTPVVVPTGSLVRTTDGGAGTGSGGGAGSGTGSGSGGGTGTGSGGGDGSGIGTGTGPGTGGRAWPPSPRALMLPPQAPSSIKGRSVTVRLSVDSAGVVQDVDLAPGSGNSDFDKKLRETARQWLFRPARDAAGRAVAALFEVVFSF